MTTFEVAKVEVGSSEKVCHGPIRDAIRATCRTTVEACGANADAIIGHMVRPWKSERDVLEVSGMNGFLQAAHRAFSDHFPLVLSPDDVWLAIAQGFAHHVNANAEALRSRFVKHDGQEYIEIQRDSFVKGSPDNDWPGAFAEFSDKIAERIGKKRDLVVSNFSTTGPIEKAASEVVFLDTMQAYFSYGLRTCCGIPSVTLLGKTDDWMNIRERASALGEYDCADWSKALGVALDHFVAATKGNADLKFWESFYKLGGGSGGPYVNGAINVFFPYLVDYRTKKNTRTNALACASDKWTARWGMSGPNTDDYPMGLSKVPFKWHYLGTTYDMHFLGGFVGASQDPLTLAMRPATGWGITDQKQAS